MEVNKTVELKTTAKAIEFSANKPTSVKAEFSGNTLTVSYFEKGKKKTAEIVLESSALVSFIFNPTTNNFDLGTDEPEGDYSYIPIGYAYVSDGAITKFIPFGAVDYSSEIDEEKTARESADELLQAKKVDKVTGKGLSTNDYTTAEKNKLAGIEDGAEANVQSDWSQSNSSADDYIKNKPQNLVQDSSYVHTDNNFNNDYKSKIETNEYNDIFNIRVEWNREYMPHAELIRISFQEYENGILVEETCSYDVKDITNGDVYLYKDTSDTWQIAVGTPPSSYSRLPMLVGKIATKTVNGESVKLFFRNGDDETQFDKLNSEKVDKVDCPIIETITLEEEVETIGRDYTISQNFTDCIVLIEFPQVTANITFNAVIFTNTYYPCCNAYYNNGISASGNRYYQIHSNIINGYRRTTSRQGLRNDKDDMHSETVWDFSGLYLYPERYQKITRISVNGISGNLPIGTKVTILGNKEQ